MIQEVTGDILLSDAAVVGHGIATQDHFDTGLALALREYFPSMVKDYRHDTHSKAVKTGEIWPWKGVDATGKTRGVVNLLTQGMHGQGPTAKPMKAKLEDVGHALKALAKYAREEKVSSLALPRLATGVGGLDWDEVKPLVQQHLGDLGIPVVVYTTYRKGEKAAEKLA